MHPSPRAVNLQIVGLLLVLSGTLCGHTGARATALPTPHATPLYGHWQWMPDGSQVYTLPRLPVHLWQNNPAPTAYANPMGCGAFSTAMALSVYDPARYGTAAAAETLFEHMVQVPLFGGTFESENAVVARRAGFVAETIAEGTVADLQIAIDLGTPVILLVDPGPFGIGQHDVVLVGYQVAPDGQVQALLVDNPARDVPAGANVPALRGNEAIPVSDLPHKWTGVFTPIFDAPDLEALWRRQADR